MAEKKDNASSSFSKDIKKVPNKILKEKLGKFGLKSSDLIPLRPIYNISDYPTEIKISPATKDDPYLGNLERYTRKLKPKSLTQLKEWVGIPNKVFEKMSKFDLEKHRNSIEPRNVNFQDLPREPKFDFKNLNREQQIAVKNFAYNLIYGYASDELVARSPFSEIVDYTLTTAGSRLTIFFAQDLIVGHNDHVIFNNFGTLYFNNIIVYGSGKITTSNQTKIHAYQIGHY